MCIGSWVPGMLLWGECLYKMQSVALSNCGPPYHCLDWSCCRVWMWPQEKRVLLGYQSARFATHWIVHTTYTYLCLKHVPFKMRSGRSRNYLFLLRSSVLCRSYFCPITGRSPCHGILRTSWLMSRWVCYLFVFVMLLSGLQNTHHSSPLTVACTIQ